MWQLTPLTQDLSWSSWHPPPAPSQVEWACAVEKPFPRASAQEPCQWRPATYKGFSATVLQFTLKQWPPFDLRKAVPRVRNRGADADSDSVDSVLGPLPESDSESVDSILGPASVSDSVIGPEEHRHAHAGSGPSAAHEPVAREGQGPARVFKR